MAYLPKRWSCKPPTSEIKRGHPLAPDVACWLMQYPIAAGASTGTLYEIVANHHASCIGPSSYGTNYFGPYGSAVLFDGNARGTNNDVIIGAGTEISVVAVLQSSILDTGYHEVLRGQTGNIFLTQNAVNAWGFTVHNDVTEYNNSAIPVNLGEWLVLIGTYSNNGGLAVYKNGVLGYSKSPAAALTSETGVYIGWLNINGSPLQIFVGAIAMVAVYSRALRQEECVQLYVDPWCFLQPQNQQQFSLGAGSVAGLAPFVAECDTYSFGYKDYPIL